MANQRPFWSKAGEAPPATPTPVSTGAPMMGTDSVLNPHNDDRASRIPNSKPVKTQFHRGSMQAEAGGARLSISPSAKIPSDGLPSGMNVNPKIVRSRAGATRATFEESEYSSQAF